MMSSIDGRNLWIHTQYVYDEGVKQTTYEE